MNSKQSVFKNKLILIIIFFSLCVHSIYAYIALNHFNFNLYPDYYGIITENFISGKGYIISEKENPVLWRPPLYILLLSTIKFFFGNNHYILVLIQIVISSFTCLIIYFSMVKVFNHSVGLFSSICWALYPLVNYYIIRELPLVLFTFLLFLMVNFSINFSSSFDRFNCFIIGLLNGLLILTKLSFKGFPYFFVFFIILIGYRKYNSHTPCVNCSKSILSKIIFSIKNFLLCFRNFVFIKNVSLNLTTFVIGLIIVISPWLIRNYNITGKFPVTGVGGGFTLWFGNNIEYDGLDYDQLSFEKEQEIKRTAQNIIGKGSVVDFDNDSKLYSAAIENFKKYPTETIILLFKKLYRLWFSIYTVEMSRYKWVVTILQLIFLAPALYGITYAILNKLNILLLILILAYFQIVYTLFTSTVRYCIPVMPIVIAFAVYGFTNIIRIKKTFT